MRTSFVRPLLFAAALALLGACDDATEPSDGLTPKEREFLASQVMGFSYGATDPPAPTASVASQSPTAQAEAPLADTLRITTLRTRACPAGGEMKIDGEWIMVTDTAAGTMTVDISGTHTPVACAFQTEEDVVITIDGDPNLAVEGHFSATENQMLGTQTMDMDGRFAWSTSDDRSGTCEASLAAEIDPAASTGVVSGSFCGDTIHIEATWTGDGS